MRSTAWIIIGVLVLAYAAFAIPMMLRFYKFCERVATATGRVAEGQSNVSIDDGGFNAFQLEQWRALMNNEQKNLPDQTLVDEGDLLSKRFRTSRAFAVAIIIVAAVMVIST